MKSSLLHFSIMLLLFASWGASSTGASELIDLLNGYNVPAECQEFLGHPYDSHGCFHFYPADIYLLYNLIPNLVGLEIKPYNVTPNLDLEAIPWATRFITTKDQIKLQQNLLTLNNTAIIGYPGSNLWVIFYQKKPLFKLKALPGPTKPYYLATTTSPNQISYDHSLSEATTPGKYYIFGRSDDFYTIHYKSTTIIPMWGKIKKGTNGYVFYRNGMAYNVPQEIAYDLTNNFTSQYKYNYFNAQKSESGKIDEAQWASHDFGKYTLFWSQDKHNICNEMAYATGQVCFEQMQYLKDLASALADVTANTQDKFLAHFGEYLEYRKIGAFLSGENNFYLNDPVVTTYLKLMYKQKIPPQEWLQVPPHLRAAYKLYYFPDDMPLTPDEITALSRVGLHLTDKYKIYGLERELFLYKIAADKLILKFSYLRKNFDFFQKIKLAALKDFDNSGIKNTAAKEKILYNMLLKRIYFDTISKEDLR